MTKVVRSVSLFARGVEALWKKGIKPLAKSKFGKIALTAAAIYFGVPALTGAFGAGATGTVMGNLSAAWGGLSSAAGSAMAGNFAQAAGQLGTGMLGSAAPMAAASGGGGMLAGTPLAAASTAAPAAAGTSMFSSPFLAPALVQAGGQMLSGAAGGYAQDKLQKEDRERYNKNVGTQLWPKG